MSDQHHNLHFEKLKLRGVDPIILDAHASRLARLIRSPEAILDSFEDLYEGDSTIGYKNRQRINELDKRIAVADKSNDFASLENFSSQRQKLLDDMSKIIVNVNNKTFQQLINIGCLKPSQHSRRPKSDCIFMTLNTFGHNKLNGNDLKTMMPQLILNTLDPKRLKDFSWCIEYGEKGNNPHVHFAFKHTYAKLHHGGTCVNSDAVNNDRSYKTRVQKYLNEFYPYIQYDLRVEGGVYSGRLVYIKKDEDPKKYLKISHE